MDGSLQQLSRLVLESASSQAPCLQLSDKGTKFFFAPPSPQPPNHQNIVRKCIKIRLYPESIGVGEFYRLRIQLRSGENSRLRPTQTPAPTPQSCPQPPGGPLSPPPGYALP